MDGSELIEALDSMGPKKSTESIFARRPWYRRVVIRIELSSWNLWPYWTQGNRYLDFSFLCFSFHYNGNV